MTNTQQFNPIDKDGILHIAETHIQIWGSITVDQTCAILLRDKYHINRFEVEWTLKEWSRLMGWNCIDNKKFKTFYKI